jgi:hypothetical protein
MELVRAAPESGLPSLLTAFVAHVLWATADPTPSNETRMTVIMVRTILFLPTGRLETQERTVRVYYRQEREAMIAREPILRLGQRRGRWGSRSDTLAERRLELRLMDIGAGSLAEIGRYAHSLSAPLPRSGVFLLEQRQRFARFVDRWRPALPTRHSTGRRYDPALSAPSEGGVLAFGNCRSVIPSAMIASNV